MKKSFLNRVAAAAMAVPVALTQTAMFTSFAAGESADEATKLNLDTFVAVTTDTEKLVAATDAYKAKEAAKENAYIQESTWNEKIKVAVNSMAGNTYDVDAVTLINNLNSQNKIVRMLKSVANEAESTATVEVTPNQIIVTLDMSLDVASAMQAMADKKGIDVTFEDHGSYTVKAVMTADVSDLANSKEIPFTAQFSGDSVSDASLEDMVAYVKNAYANMENIARSTIKNNVDEYRAQVAEKQAEKDQKQAEKDQKQQELDDLVAENAPADEIADAQAKLDDAQAKLDDAQAKLDDVSKQLDDAEKLANGELDEVLAPIKTKIDTAEKYIEKAKNERHVAYTAKDAADLYEQVRIDAENSRFGDKHVGVGSYDIDMSDVPATLTDAFNSTIYGSAVNYITKVLAMVNNQVANTGYQIDVTAADMENMLQKAYDLEVAGNTANYVADGNAFFYLPDTDADMAAYTKFFNEKLAADELEVDEIYSVKAVEADGNADANTWNGDATLNIYRVVWYTTKELEETTDPSSTDPTDPSSTDPTDPSSTDPTDPSSTDPTDPSSTDPTDPSSTDPTDPSSTDPTDVPVIEIAADKGFYFAHDTNAFDAKELVTVSKKTTIDVDFSKFSFGVEKDAPVKDLNPAQVYNSNVDSDGNPVAYAWKPIYVFYNGKAAVDAEGKQAVAYVYIGVKGDADLNGVADASDAATVLMYAAAKGAGATAYLTVSGDTLPESSKRQEEFAFFLADTDTESTVGASEGMELDASDASNILIYSAIMGVEGKCNWIPEVLSKPYPKYSEQIALKAGLID